MSSSGTRDTQPSSVRTWKEGLGKSVTRQVVSLTIQLSSEAIERQEETVVIMREVYRMTWDIACPRQKNLKNLLPDLGRDEAPTARG